MKKKNDNIEILFEDDDIVVVSKPAGVLSIPDRYNKTIPNLYGILTEKYGEIFVAHRLDKDTSGVMIFARNACAHKHLNTQFEEQRVKKLYHLVLSGVVNKDEIKIDIPLAPDPSKKGVMIPSARGKESLTNLKVMTRYRVATLVECDLVTGRHHQLRAHCAAIGFPLLVDEIYGASEEFLLSTIKKRYNLKKDEVERPIISRVSMHASFIRFEHPSTKQQVEFTAEYPKDFQALLQVLGKYSEIPEYYHQPIDYDFDFDEEEEE